MTLSMFQAPTVGLRETETEGETALAAIAAEVTFPAVSSWRRGEQFRSLTPGGSARIVVRCVLCADPWRAEDSMTVLP